MPITTRQMQAAPRRYDNAKPPEQPDALDLMTEEELRAEVRRLEDALYKMRLDFDTWKKERWEA